MSDKGSILIKPNPRRNFYVVWDRTGELPVSWGSKRYLKKQAEKIGLLNGPLEEEFNKRFALADIYSFSTANRGYSWEEDFTIPYSSFGYVRRTNIPRLIKIYKKTNMLNHEDILALLQPTGKD